MGLRTTTPNLQEMFERDKYVLIYSSAPLKIGSIIQIDEHAPWGPGAIVKVIEQVSTKEAHDYLMKNFGETGGPIEDWYWYKVVAE